MQRVIDEWDADLQRVLLAHSDRPLLLRQVSRGVRAVVQAGKLPLDYVFDTAKYKASPVSGYMTEVGGGVLAELLVKATEFDVRSIKITGLMWFAFKDARGLAATVALCPNLTSLDLSHNNIRPKTLVRVFAVCTTLRRLVLTDFNYNQTWNSTKRLWDSVKCPRLEVLEVDNCKILDRRGEDLVLRALSNLLLRSPALRQLDLSRNGFDIGGNNFARVIAPALPRLRELRVLNLSSNDMDKEGLSALGGVLSTLPELADLDVGNNKMKRAYVSAGTWEFARGLTQCDRLQRLVLRYNDFGDETADLLEALPHCGALTELDVSTVTLTLAHENILLGVLPQCANLESLYVRSMFWNYDIGWERADRTVFSELPPVLEQCKKLQRVFVGDGEDDMMRLMYDWNWRVVHSRHGMNTLERVLTTR